jgi:hypothetical protein
VEWNVLGNMQNMTLWSGFAGVCMDEAQERVAPAMGVAMMWNRVLRDPGDGDAKSSSESDEVDVLIRDFLAGKK